MHRNKGKTKIVKHVSISFKGLFPLPVKASATLESLTNSPEKLIFSTNGRSKAKIVHLSINSLLKENQSSLKLRNASGLRREKLKQLSSGYKLRRDSSSLFI